MGLADGRYCQVGTKPHSPLSYKRMDVTPPAALSAAPASAEGLPLFSRAVVSSDGLELAEAAASVEVAGVLADYQMAKRCLPAA
jgi:hypothetical protein